MDEWRSKQKSADQELSRLTGKFMAVRKSPPPENSPPENSPLEISPLGKVPPRNSPPWGLGLELGLGYGTVDGKHIWIECPKFSGPCIITTRIFSVWCY